MRSAAASLLAAGVLALGAVPATLALADEGVAGKGKTGQAAGRDGAGPPAWAPAHGHDRTKAKHADKARAQALKRHQQADWPADAQGPPPWAKAHGKRENRGTHGEAHAKAMRQWERCVAAAEPGVDCGQKPTPPGRTG